VPKALTQQPLEDALHLLGPADSGIPDQQIPNLPTTGKRHYAQVVI